tara:strand:- start:21128 stop:25027 length:3900 start_codon:yes stop_codon:yes gene_type:complete
MSDNFNGSIRQLINNDNVLLSIEHVLVIAIDTTGSMQKCLDAVRKSLIASKRLLIASGIKLKIVIFGDYDKPSYKIDKVVNIFDGTVEECVEYIRYIKLNTCGSGGDVAEAHISVLAKLVNEAKENERYSILLWSDAFPHYISDKFDGKMAEYEQIALVEKYPGYPRTWEKAVDDFFQKGHVMGVITASYFKKNEELSNTYEQIKELGGFVSYGLNHDSTREDLMCLFSCSLCLLALGIDDSFKNLFEVLDTDESSQQLTSFQPRPELFNSKDVEPMTFYNNIRQYCIDHPYLLGWIVWASSTYYSIMSKNKLSNEHSEFISILKSLGVPPEILKIFTNMRFNFLDLDALNPKYKYGKGLILDSSKFDNKLLPDEFLKILADVFNYRNGSPNNIKRIKPYIEGLKVVNRVIGAGRGLVSEAMKHEKQGLTLLLSYISGKNSEYSKGILPMFISVLLRWSSPKVLEHLMPYIITEVNNENFLGFTIDQTKPIPPRYGNVVMLDFILKSLMKLPVSDSSHIIEQKLDVIRHFIRIIKIKNSLKEVIDSIKTIVSRDKLSHSDVFDAVKKSNLFAWFYDIVLQRPFPCSLAVWVSYLEVKLIVKSIKEDTRPNGFYSHLSSNALEFALAIAKQDGGLYLSPYTIYNYKDNDGKHDRFKKLSSVSQKDIDSISKDLSKHSWKQQLLEIPYITNLPDNPDSICRLADNRKYCKRKFYNIMLLYYKTTGGPDGSRLFSQLINATGDYIPGKRECKGCKQVDGSSSCFDAVDCTVNKNDSKCYNCRGRWQCTYCKCYIKANNSQKKKSNSFSVTCGKCSSEVPIPPKNKVIKCQDCHVSYVTGIPSDSDIQPCPITEDNCVHCIAKKNIPIVEHEDCRVPLNLFINQCPENINSFGALFGVHPDILKYLIGHKPFETISNPEFRQFYHLPLMPSILKNGIKIHDKEHPDDDSADSGVTLELEDIRTTFINSTLKYGNGAVTNTEDIYELIFNNYKVVCYICGDEVPFSNMISPCGNKCADLCCSDCFESSYTSPLSKESPISVSQISCIFCRGELIYKNRKSVSLKTECPLVKRLMIRKELYKSITGRIGDGKKIVACCHWNPKIPITIIRITKLIELGSIKGPFDIPIPHCRSEIPYHELLDGCRAAGIDVDVAGPADEPTTDKSTITECPDCNTYRAKLYADYLKRLAEREKAERETPKLIEVDNEFLILASELEDTSRTTHPTLYRKCPNCGEINTKDEECWSVTCRCSIHFCWCCGKTGQIYPHLENKFGSCYVHDTPHYDHDTGNYISVEADYDSDEDELE